MDSRAGRSTGKNLKLLATLQLFSACLMSLLFAGVLSLAHEAAYWKALA